jgi:hypothetical protein
LRSKAYGSGFFSNGFIKQMNEISWSKSNGDALVFKNMLFG